MKTIQQDKRLESFKRAIAIAGSAIGAGWGIQWIVRMADPFGSEGRLQLTFSFAVTLGFVVLAADKKAPRWFWANNAVLSVLWAWRSSHKHYPLGVAAFLTAAGLAIAGFLVAFRQRAAR